MFVLPYGRIALVFVVVESKEIIDVHVIVILTF